jgi:hypothetical protein
LKLSELHFAAYYFEAHKAGVILESFPGFTSSFCEFVVMYREKKDGKGCSAIASGCSMANPARRGRGQCADRRAVGGAGLHCEGKAGEEAVISGMG